MSVLLADFVGRCRRLLGLDSHKRVFNRYYSRDTWIGGGSGTGSTIENTVAYRVLLSSFLRDNQVASAVDLGCGDWQFSRHVDWTGVDYLGVDVSSVVLENTAKFTRPGVRFLELDASAGDLPSADLLIAKDVLQHWSNADIAHFLPSLRKFKYALITNGSDKTARTTNSDIKAGECRPVDLSVAPFGLSGEVVLEYVADEPKTVFLWRRSDR